MNNNVVNIKNGTSNFIPLKVKDRADRYNVPNAPMPTVKVEGNSGNLKMLPNYAYFAGKVYNIDIELLEDNEENYVNYYYLMFEGSNNGEIHLPKGLKYGEEEEGAIITLEGDKTYELSILNKCVALKSYAMSEKDRDFYMLEKHPSVSFDGTFLIVDVRNDNWGYALSSANGDSASPELVYVNIENGVIKGTDVTDDMKWKLEPVLESSALLHPAKQPNKSLYYNTTEEGIRVGSNTTSWWFNIRSDKYPNFHSIADDSTGKLIGVNSDETAWIAESRVYDEETETWDLAPDTEISGSKIEFFILK